MNMATIIALRRKMVDMLITALDKEYCPGAPETHKDAKTKVSETLDSPKKDKKKP
jgi:hypothetical protein